MCGKQVPSTPLLHWLSDFEDFEMGIQMERVCQIDGLLVQKGSGCTKLSGLPVYHQSWEGDFPPDLAEAAARVPATGSARP